MSGVDLELLFDTKIQQMFDFVKRIFEHFFDFSCFY